MRKLILLLPAIAAVSLLLLTISGNVVLGTIWLPLIAFAIAPAQVVTVAVLKKLQKNLTRSDLAISGIYLAAVIILLAAMFLEGNILPIFPFDYPIVILPGLNFIASLASSIILARKRTLISLSGPWRAAIVTSSFAATLVTLLIFAYIGLLAFAHSLEGSLQ